MAAKRLRSGRPPKPTPAEIEACRPLAAALARLLAQYCERSGWLEAPEPAEAVPHRKTA